VKRLTDENLMLDMTRFISYCSVGTTRDENQVDLFSRRTGYLADDEVMGVDGYHDIDLAQSPTVLCQLW
jgi:hypothetical protein